MLQSTSEYEERNFDDIQRALDIEHTVKALESQLCYDQHSPEEVARQILKATCKFYDADWCGLMVTHAAIAVILKDIPPESEGFTFRRDFLFFIIKASSCSLRRWPHIKELWPHWPST